MVGVYKITNPKGKIYIGQTKNYNKRLNQYINLSGSVKNQIKLFNSLKKYNSKNHIFEIIEECSIEKLDEREIYWIEYYNSFNDGLNLTKGGKKAKLSEESKKIISEKLKGKIKGDYHTKEFKEKISKIQKGNKYKLGIKHSDRTKQNISLKNKKPKPEGFGEKISEANKGVTRNKGKKFTKEQKQNLSNALKGKKSSYKMKILFEQINNIKIDYEIVSLPLLALKYNVSHPTMRIFLKENNLFQFRKNYKN